MKRKVANGHLLVGWPLVRDPIVRNSQFRARGRSIETIRKGTSSLSRNARKPEVANGHLYVATFWPPWTAAAIDRPQNMSGAHIQQAARPAGNGRPTLKPKQPPRPRSARTVRLDAMTTALYRFFNAADELLYIGISNAVPTRLDQHEDTKRWYHEVARIAVEHYPNRPTALVYEEAAIKAEKPKYNIVHNHGRRPDRRAKASASWTFSSRRTGHERTTELYLMPELDCSSMVDDYGHLDGEGQLQAYVEYLEENHPEWLQANAVPILWSVEGRRTFENAPFQVGTFGRDGDWGARGDFLTAYTWPYNEATGDLVDWFKLPFRYRFPSFSEALGWTPSPMQPTCPLLSVLANRDGLELPYGAREQ